MLRTLFTLLALLLSITAGAQAPTALGDAPVQAPAAAEGQIVAISIQGNKRIEDATVLAAIRMREGEELTAAKVRRDLRAVFATGFFDDVRIQANPAPGGVEVVFLVDEKPAIMNVRIAGNKKIDEEDIREVIDLRTFSVLTQSELQANTSRVRDLYVEKGYYLVDVDVDVVDVGDDQVDVVFDITENKKVIVQRIEFTGNDNVPDQRIKRYLQTKEGGIAPWLTNRGTFRREALDADVETIRYVFLEEGFVDVAVDEPEVYLSPDKRFIYVTFNVDEGERYEIDEIRVEGDFIADEGLTPTTVHEVIAGRQVVDIEEEQWREASGRGEPLLSVPESRGVSLEKGQVFKLSELQRVVSAISDLYANKGYAFANVVPLPYTDPETRTVDVTFQIETGEKVRIGRIDIVGNDPTLDKVIRRELLFNEGELYNQTLIRASKVRLQRLGFFEQVNISTPRGAAEGTVDVNVAVTEQPTGSFSLGLGYSNLESFVLTGSISKNNFLGLGYVFSGMINWSSLRKQGNVSVFDPYFLDSRWTLKLDAYNITRQFVLNEYQRGGSVAVGRYLDPRDDIRLTFEYTLEDVGLTSLDPFKTRVLGGDLYRNGLTSSVGSTLSVDKRNNRILPTQGFYASAAIEMAGGFRIDDDRVLSLLGGDFNFVEARGNLRFYQPIIPDKDWLIFRFNSTIGRIWSTDGRVIPFIHRFRAGGINSVRGYDWYSLGPAIRASGTDDPIAGDDRLVVGGSSTWINNIEVVSPIVKAAGISGVVFFDAGNAFGDPWDGGGISPKDLRFSYGAGIRWQSPLGPLRFEYGIPINRREGERPGVFDFSIGSFF